MAKRILFGCDEVPECGRAATSHYQLFERMLRDGFDAAYVNLVPEADELFLRYQFGDHCGNPRALDNVYNCVLDEPQRSLPLARLIESLAPDLLLASGHIATLLLKRAAPQLPVVFIAAGSQRLQSLIETCAVRDFMGFERSVARGVVFSVPPDCPEQAAVAASELVVVSSAHVRFAFEHFFGPHFGKIYATTVSPADLTYAEAEQFKDLRRPFLERDIDIIFAAGSWCRPEQSHRLARQIASRCHGLNIHVIGAVDRQRFPATHHGVMARCEKRYALFGRCKTVVCPSLADTVPCALFEASAMGCNVIASPNCDSALLCNEQLLVERSDCNAFIGTIRRALTEVHQDNRERLFGGYGDLVDTLSAL